MATAISAATLALTAALSVGGTGAGVPATADAPAVTNAASVVSTDRPAPPPPPQRFRMRFGDQEQCLARARRDHPGRPGDWNCRRGGDPRNPWEYWGR